MEKRYDSLLADNNSEIEQMKVIISNHNKTENKTENVDSVKDDDKNDDIQNFVKTIKDNEKLKVAFKIIDHYILGGYVNIIKADGISPEILSYYVSNELIESTPAKNYKWTEKGMKVYKIISNEPFEYK
jgi:F0F1-type ATP synthase delta subunit